MSVHRGFTFQWQSTSLLSSVVEMFFVGPDAVFWLQYLKWPLKGGGTVPVWYLGLENMSCDTQRHKIKQTVDDTQTKI